MSAYEASSSNKDVRALLKLARRQGWRVLTNGNHFKWYSPDGKTLIVTANTPSDRRALMNMTRDLRRAGLVL